MKLIIGLGNPGKQYENTRHNAGFWAIDELSRKWHVPIFNPGPGQFDSGQQDGY
ncbi:MAG: hypothetical protein ACLQNE_41335 [Thermoguttaceae bacterium]